MPLCPALSRYPIVRITRPRSGRSRLLFQPVPRLSPLTTQVLSPIPLRSAHPPLSVLLGRRFPLLSQVLSPSSSAAACSSDALLKFSCVLLPGCLLSPRLRLIAD